MPDDPITAYLAKYGAKQQSNPLDSYLAKYGGPKADDEGGLATDVLHTAEGFGAGIGRSLLQTSRGVAALGGYAIQKIEGPDLESLVTGHPPENVLTRAADTLGEMQSEIDKSVEGKAGAGGEIAGNLATNVAQALVPGMRAVKLAAPLGKAAQFAAGTAAYVPFSAINAAGGRESSTTGLAADLAAKAPGGVVKAAAPLLERAASSTGSRIVGDIVLDAATSGATELALRGLGQAARNVLKKTLPDIPAFPSMVGEDLDNAVATVDRTPAPGEGGRPPVALTSEQTVVRDAIQEAESAKPVRTTKRRTAQPNAVNPKYRLDSDEALYDRLQALQDRIVDTANGKYGPLAWARQTDTGAVSGAGPGARRAAEDSRLSAEVIDELEARGHGSASDIFAHLEERKALQSAESAGSDAEFNALMFGEQAPERIAPKEPAAIQVKGKIYRGTTHAEAEDKYLQEQGKDLGDYEARAALYDAMNGGEVQSGFVTEGGRFVDIDEADAIAEAANQVREGERSRGSGGLASEDLIGYEETAAPPAERRATPRTRPEDRRVWTPLERAEYTLEQLRQNPESPRLSYGMGDAEAADIFRQGRETAFAGRRGAIDRALGITLGKTAAGAAVGGVAGARYGDTEAERRRNAVFGAITGAAIAAGSSPLFKALKKVSPSSLTKPYMANPDVAAVAGKIAFEPRDMKGTPILDRVYALYQEYVNSYYGAEKLSKAVGSTRFLNEVRRAKSYVEPAMLRLEDDLTPVLRAAKGNEAGVATLAAAERAIELAKNGHAEKGFDLGHAERTVAFFRSGQYPEVVAAADRLREYYRSLLDYKARNGVISAEQYQALIDKGEYYIPFVRDFAGERSTALPYGQSTLNKSTGIRRMFEGKANAAIVDPFHQAVLDTFETERRVAKQRATNVLADIVESDPQSVESFVHETQPPQTKNTRVEREGVLFEANVGGRRKYYQITDPNLVKTMASMSPPVEGLATKILRAGKTALQTGVTIMPAFGAANAARDLASTVIKYPLHIKTTLAGGLVGGTLGYYEDGEKGAAIGAALGLAGGATSIHLLRTLSALGDILGAVKSPAVGAAIGGGIGYETGDDSTKWRRLVEGAAIGAGLGGVAGYHSDPAIYREWLREGGAGHGYFARTPKDAAKLLEIMRKEPGFDVRDVINPRSYWEALQYVNRSIEQAPRLARYKYLRGKGLLPANSIADVPEAISGSKNISVNFEQHGSSLEAQMVASTTAFLNPAVQGLDWLTRTLSDPKAWGRAASLITASSVALWWLNSSNDDYWQVPTAIRNTYWLLPKESGGFYKVPKPFEVGFIFASVPERFLDWVHQRDPERTREAFKDLSAQMFGGLLPVPTLVKPLAEVAFNRDTYFNRPIESQGDQSRSPEFRYDDRTSSLAVALGHATGISPKKIDHVSQGLTGPLGQIAANEIGRAVRGLGLDPRGGLEFVPTGSDRGQFSRFATQPNTQTDDASTLFRRFDSAQKTYNDVRLLYQPIENMRADAIPTEAERQAVERFQSYVREHRDALKTYLALKPRVDWLEKISAERRKLQGNLPPYDNFSGEQREKALASLARLAGKIASGAFIPPTDAEEAPQ